VTSGVRFGLAHSSNGL
jgi:hypothetical protein